MPKSCSNEKINDMWVRDPSPWKLLNSGDAFCYWFKKKKTKNKTQSSLSSLHISALIAGYYIKEWVAHNHSSHNASVFTEAAWLNLTNWICSSSIQDSANQPYQFSIFPTIYGHPEQIPELVGSCCRLTHSLVSGGKKKEFHTRRSLCNREQGDQPNESWNYCLQSNSSAAERKKRMEHAAACRVSRVLR